LRGRRLSAAEFASFISPQEIFQDRTWRTRSALRFR
jgi:hypothetical protein